MASQNSELTLPVACSQGITLPPSCTHGYLFSTEVTLLSIAAGMWLIAVVLALARHRIRGRFWRPSAYVLVSFAVYLHPTVTSAALGLLNCQTVPLSSTAAAALEDGSTSPALSLYSAAAALSYISVLLSNPFVPCFGRLHAPAGGLAAATIVVYVIAMPLLTFRWLWRDQWLADRLAAQAPRLTEQQQRHRRRSSAIVPSSLDVRIAEPVDDVSDSKVERFQIDPILAPFLKDSGYEYRAWYMRHIDLLVVCGLSSVNALLPIPSSVSQVAVKLAMTLLLLATLAALLLFLRNPYQEPWKRSVRLALIALSAACAAINAASRSLDLGYGGAVLEATISPGAFCILGILCITGAVLLVGFGRDVIIKALDEETERVKDERQAAVIEQRVSSPFDGSELSPATAVSIEGSGLQSQRSTGSVVHVVVTKAAPRGGGSSRGGWSGGLDRVPASAVSQRPTLCLPSPGVSATSPDVERAFPGRRSFDEAQGCDTSSDDEGDDDVGPLSVGATPLGSRVASRTGSRWGTQTDGVAEPPLSRRSGTGFRGADAEEGSTSSHGGGVGRLGPESSGVQSQGPDFSSFSRARRSAPLATGGALLAFPSNPPPASGDLQPLSASLPRAPTSRTPLETPTYGGPGSVRRSSAGAPPAASPLASMPGAWHGDDTSPGHAAGESAGVATKSLASVMRTTSAAFAVPRASPLVRRASLQTKKAAASPAFNGRPAFGVADMLSVAMAAAEGVERKRRASLSVLPVASRALPLPPPAAAPGSGLEASSTPAGIGRSPLVASPAEGAVAFSEVPERRRRASSSSLAVAARITPLPPVACVLENLLSAELEPPLPQNVFGDVGDVLSGGPGAGAGECRHRSSASGLPVASRVEPLPAAASPAATAEHVVLPARRRSFLAAAGASMHRVL